ncbi:MAG: energy transducer TonB [Bacteroidales bacterium]|nr:energy transducer TonB [Bacteroidales bacterium]MDT8372837.1 energy transducer TonB [Bacteroidales bacterium]
MAKEKKKYPSLDDIVFENRNKEYGAYDIRRRYSRTMSLSILIGIIVVLTAAIVPYIRAKNIAQVKQRDANEVIAEMANDLQQEEAAPPPPPPPPPPEEQQTVVKYVAPVVVDTIKPEEATQFMTADDVVETVVDADVVEVIEQVQEEIQEEAPQEVFVVVEEMPSFPGGDVELFKFIYDNIKYPELAKENNIQGKVILRFCVTYKGTVDQVSIVRGVDPSLDNEAIRVIKMLPLWKPGKQGGKPVNVWYSVPINFQLK